MYGQTKLPLISGILTIIAAALTIIAGILTINGALITYGGYGYGFIEGTNTFFWITGVFEIIGFAAGLTSAIFQMKKQYFLATIFSNILLLVSASMLTAESFFKIGRMDMTFGYFLFLAIPILVMSILSIVFIAVSKKEFTS